ncbi:SdiA-regulated domain-containing protein [Bordetella sp. N]|uniref:SdiA-regulated domain-containing protein n=1 Tax=Bordetella sp. N TaxID=1746199 RepID=UPI0012E3F724|nr:SdiA-regulated domain-containing protein [Bordetella sp. N]
MTAFAVLCGVAAAAWYGWHTRWLARQGFVLQREIAQARSGTGAPDLGTTLMLDRYVADIQALRVGDEANMSSVTYDAQRHILVSITNRQPHLLELSLDGVLQRRVPLSGFGDPEAVEYLVPGRYMIAEERRRRVTEVTLDAGTDQVVFDTGAQRHLTLGPPDDDNRGFEALAYDAGRQRLYIGKENDPVRIFEVEGLFAPTGQPLNVNVHVDPARDRRLFLTDISGMVHDSRTGHLLVLSDESKLVIELDAAGQPVGMMSLRAGQHGLLKDIPQAEGIALDDAGNLYIVSEPNLFYRFRQGKVAG